MKELGIRVALGARTKHVMSAAVGRPIALLVVGSLAGLLSSLVACGGTSCIRRIRGIPSSWAALC